MKATIFPNVHGIREPLFSLPGDLSPAIYLSDDLFPSDPFPASFLQWSLAASYHRMWSIPGVHSDPDVMPHAVIIRPNQVNTHLTDRSRPIQPTDPNEDCKASNCTTRILTTHILFRSTSHLHRLQLRCFWLIQITNVPTLIWVQSTLRSNPISSPVRS